MSEPAQTTARKLETTFRAVFAAALDPAIKLYVQNEEVPQTDDQVLPSVILSAKVTGDYKAFKMSGRWADLCELKMECRVDGAKPESSRAIEVLANSVKQAFENALPAQLTGWNYLHFESQGDETGFDGAARVKSLIYEVRAHPV